MQIPCALVTVYLVILILRAVFSWFPVQPGTFLAQANRILIDLTEWALRPLRQIIPPAGMIDLSFLVLVVILLVLQNAIC